MFNKFLKMFFINMYTLKIKKKRGSSIDLDIHNSQVSGSAYS